MTVYSSIRTDKLTNNIHYVDKKIKNTKMK